MTDTRHTDLSSAVKRATYSQKMLAAAGSVSALYLLPTLAQGGAIHIPDTFAADGSIVHVTGSPVSISMNDSPGTAVSWDVDGDGNAEFELFRAGTTFSNATSFGTYSSIFLGSQTYNYAPLNGRGLVRPDPSPGDPALDNVQALGQSFIVGQTLAAGYAWGAGSNSGYRYRNMMYSSYANVNGSVTVSQPATIGYDLVDFVLGDNFVGFRFDDGAGGLLNGWANINIDNVAGGGTVTITEWAFMKNVPEPSTPALLLLGLGAAGLRGWRNRKDLRAEARA